jgi:hypothetical protein
MFSICEGVSVMRVSRLLAPACGVLIAIAAWPSDGAAAEAVKVARSKKPPSACVGLSETVCSGNAACYWRKASVLKTGKTRRAHCHLKPHSAKKSSST